MEVVAEELEVMGDELDMAADEVVPVVAAEVVAAAVVPVEAAAQAFVGRAAGTYVMPLAAKAELQMVSESFCTAASFVSTFGPGYDKGSTYRPIQPWSKWTCKGKERHSGQSPSRRWCIGNSNRSSCSR